MHPSVLVIDDENSIRTAISMMLRDKYQVFTAKSGAEGVKLVKKETIHAILLDIGLPDVDGIELINRLKESAPDAAVVMITAVDDVASIVRAIRRGAYDYLVKPIEGQALKITLRNALSQRSLKDKIRRIQKPDLDRYRATMIGEDPQVKSLLSIAEKLSVSPETPVLITGESGTGKGVLARIIHYNASDDPGPFLPVNCTAITHELFESELFGYEKGAFTGARGDGKAGRFEEAADGAIFLDEIGAMAPTAQAKLLGVIEDRQFFRVGGNKAFPVACRIIAATNQDLEAAVADGTFRNDLYYRLNVVALRLPPLRERPDDILPLANHFLELFRSKFGKAFTSISDDVCDMLRRYAWPGNVRELRNTLERVVLLENDDTVRPEHLDFLRVENAPASEGPDFSSEPSIDYQKAVKSLIQEGLERSGGNVVEAARILNMPLHKIRYRIKKYGMNVSD